MSNLKSTIDEATKTAMRAREKERVATLRMVNAEIKRIEIDERRALDDEDILNILNKMVKQRQDAFSQFANAGRDDLANQEAFEIDLIGEFLPEKLSADEVAALVDAVIVQTGASGMQDMGKVMGLVKEQSQGQADMGMVSGRVKAKLSEG